MNGVGNSNWLKHTSVDGIRQIGCANLDDRHEHLPGSMMPNRKYYPDIYSVIKVIKDALHTSTYDSLNMQVHQFVRLSAKKVCRATNGGFP